MDRDVRWILVHAQIQARLPAWPNAGPAAARPVSPPPPADRLPLLHLPRDRSGDHLGRLRAAVRRHRARRLRPRSGVARRGAARAPRARRRDPRLRSVRSRSGRPPAVGLARRRRSPRDAAADRLGARLRCDRRAWSAARRAGRHGGLLLPRDAAVRDRRGRRGDDARSRAGGTDRPAAELRPRAGDADVRRAGIQRQAVGAARRCRAGAAGRLRRLARRAPAARRAHPARRRGRATALPAPPRGLDRTSRRSHPTAPPASGPSRRRRREPSTRARCTTRRCIATRPSPAPSAAPRSSRPTRSPGARSRCRSPTACTTTRSPASAPSRGRRDARVHGPNLRG